MITQTTIAVPTKHLDLGDRVKFHHRAGVARVLGDGNTDSILGWKLVEGYYKNEVYVPNKHEVYDPDKHDVFNTEEVRRMFFDNPRHIQRYNKTVMMWPDEGEGIIVGMVRRGIGYSYSGSYSSYHNEYDPGGFDAKEWVWLYIVKERLNGDATILCPLDAVSKIGG